MTVVKEAFYSFKPNLISYVLGLAFFFIPFENFVVPVLSKMFGSYFFLVHPTFLASICLIGSRRTRSDDKWLLLLVLGFFVSFVYNSSQVSISFSLIILYLTSYFSVSTSKSYDSVKYLFYGSLTAFIVYISLYIHYNYLIYFIYGAHFNSIEHSLIYNRFIEDLPESIQKGNLYGLFVGNSNKASNISILYSLLAYACYCKKLISRKLMMLVLVSQSLLIILFFSRGAFVVSFLIGSGFLVLDILTKMKKEWLVYLVFIIPFLFSVSSREFRNYWINWSTVESRSIQQKDALRFVALDEFNSSNSLKSLIGLGPGGYGLSKFGSVDAGTHNFLLDIYFSGGVISLSAILILLISPVYRRLKSWKRRKALSKNAEIILALFCAVCLLSFRELDFVYLFRLNQFGFLYFMINALEEFPSS